jgi:hypothetical protein
MIFPCFPSLLLPMVLLQAVPLAAAQEGNPPAVGRVDCSKVLARMKADFAREPGRMLLSLEDALATSEVCVCPLVRAAVDFAGNDGDLIGHVVITAIRMTPSAAALIAECAATEAPEAAPAIRLALSRELGEKGPALLAPEAPGRGAGEPAVPSAAPAPAGKTPDHEAAAPAPSGPEDPGGEAREWPAVGVSGIYYAPLSRGGASFRTNPPLLEKVLEIRVPGKTAPRRPVAPVTRNSPD